jgi:hypothetical protein
MFFHRSVLYRLSIFPLQSIRIFPIIDLTPNIVQQVMSPALLPVPILIYLAYLLTSSIFDNIDNQGLEINKSIKSFKFIESFQTNIDLFGHYPQ